MKTVHGDPNYDYCTPLPDVTFENVFDLGQLLDYSNLEDAPVQAVNGRPETSLPVGLYLFKGPGFDPYRFAMTPSRDIFYCKEGDDKIDEQRLVSLRADLTRLAQLKAWGLRDLPVCDIRQKTHTAFRRQVADALIEQGRIADRDGKLISTEQSSKELVVILTEWFRLQFQAAAAGREITEMPTINDIMDEVYIATCRLNPGVAREGEIILNEAGRARYMVEKYDTDGFSIKVGTQLKGQDGEPIGPKRGEKIRFTRSGGSDSTIFAYHDKEGGKYLVINLSEPIKVVRIVDNLA